VVEANGRAIPTLTPPSESSSRVCVAVESNGPADSSLVVASFHNFEPGIDVGYVADMFELPVLRRRLAAQTTTTKTAHFADAADAALVHDVPVRVSVGGGAGFYLR